MFTEKDGPDTVTAISFSKGLRDAVLLIETVCVAKSNDDWSVL